MLKPIPSESLVEIGSPVYKVSFNGKSLELANELDKSRQEPYTSEHLVGQAATMLRKQQEEIKALKAKTLTDEEIMGVINSPQFEQLFDLEDFARAILRKAQENECNFN